MLNIYIIGSNKHSWIQFYNAIKSVKNQPNQNLKIQELTKLGIIVKSW